MTYEDALLSSFPSLVLLLPLLRCRLLPLLLPPLLHRRHRL